MWFLDRSLCWHFLTPSFTSYYRLMITHLGLPEWQYAFTPYGPSPQAKVPEFIRITFRTVLQCKSMFLLKIHKIQVWQMVHTVLEKFINTAKLFYTVCRKRTQCCRFIITKHFLKICTSWQYLLVCRAFFDINFIKMSFKWKLQHNIVYKSI